MKPTNTGEDYYVYCYSDPRNLEIFYYGKGTGDRNKNHIKEAQWRFEKGSMIKRMTARIKEIQDAGSEPDIKIIAAHLTEDQAFLVEAALIWKSGRQLVNVVSEQYTDKFRPKDTLHKKLAGFDFSNRIHFFNVGEGKRREWEEHRSWDDCYAHGFLSTGYGLEYKRYAEQLNKGDIVLAYLSQLGYVGVGRVTAEAVPACDFYIGKRKLKEMSLHAKDMCHDSDDLEMCEYVTGVKWLVKKKRDDALWKSGLFSARQTRVEMTNQQKTLRYIEQEWGKELGRSFEEILEDKSN